jgi:hypothetical protein
VPNPLAAHPPWRQLLIVSIALPVLVTLAVLAFAWPAARVQPRNLPVGVVGAGSQLAVGRLSTTQPGAFDVHLYPDEAAARAAIRNREVYGAFVLAPQQVQVLTASAASPTVAQLLSSAGTKLAPGATSTDIVPLAHADPRGTVFSSALLPLTMCSLIVAAAIGLVARFRPAWRQLAALILLSAVAGACVYLVGQSFLGALPHQGLADWAALTLTVFAMAATGAGLVALWGPPGLGIAGGLMVFVGNPFSGVTSAPELLPDAVRRIGQALPPGAGANLLRSTAYFDGHGASGPIAMLVTWAVLGCAAIALGHHAPIRFAAHRARPASRNPAVQTAHP